MTEHERDNRPDKPTFIMVPKRLMMAIIVGFLVLLIGNIAAVQWASWVDHKSNARWCGIVILFDDSNKASPPKTDFGKQIAAEFNVLRKDWCN